MHIALDREEEESLTCGSAVRRGAGGRVRGGVVRLSTDPARRPSCELPQGRKAARVNGLWRVRGVLDFVCFCPHKSGC